MSKLYLQDVLVGQKLKDYYNLNNHYDFQAIKMNQSGTEQILLLCTGKDYGDFSTYVLYDYWSEITFLSKTQEEEELENTAQAPICTYNTSLIGAIGEKPKSITIEF